MQAPTGFRSAWAAADVTGSDSEVLEIAPRLTPYLSLRATLPSHTHSLAHEHNATHIDKTSRTSRSHASVVFAVHARTHARPYVVRSILHYCSVFFLGEVTAIGEDSG